MVTVHSTFESHPSAMAHQIPGNSPGKSVDFETNLTSADRIVSFWDSNSSKRMLFQSSRKEINEYLTTVDGLRYLMEDLFITHSSSAELVRAQRLTEMSMAYLQKEFHRILSVNVHPIMLVADGCNSSHSALSDDRSTDEDRSSAGRRQSGNSIDEEITGIDMMPLDAVLDLRSIAKRIVAGGYGRECVRIYGLIRNSVIQGCLNRVGVDRLSTTDLHKIEWGNLDIKIKKWIPAMRIAVKIVFASEKRLCDEIFSGHNNARDFCFAEVVKRPMTKLLDFAESVAASRRSTERLFRILDVYETLSDLMPDIDTIFCHESCAIVRRQASTILGRLGESARGMLAEFENAIQTENSKTPVPGGTIHPLTRYVMNYLGLLSEYKKALMNIIADAPTDIPRALPDGFMGFYDHDLDGHNDELGSPASALSVRVGWIIIILQCKLEIKAKLYNDVAQSYLFLMNNLHYIVKKVKGSELLKMFGYGWLRKNEGKVRQYAANYERAAWMIALNCLGDEGILVNGDFSNGPVSQQALEDRFKRFNFAIEEVLMKHSGWIVSDVQLQEELRISVAEKMIPAYQSFIGRFKSYLESVRHSDMSMKYTPENLEALLLDLFHSNPSSTSSTRSSTGSGVSINN